MSSLRGRIQDGIDGKYKGLDNGLGDINKYIFNILRGIYTLIGGLSGAAKTTLMDFMILKAIAHAKKDKIPLTIFYYCFEIKEETKKLNWLSVHIYQKYGVVIPPQVIGGLDGAKMTDYEAKLVDAEIDYIEQLFKEIHFRFEPTNPTGIYHELFEYGDANGTYVKEKYTLQGETKYRIVRWIANDPTAYTLVAIDHIALAKRERNYGLKENIDKLSEYFVQMRNICNMSFFVVQQFNQSLNSVDRMKMKGVDLSPQQNDFKDSNNTYADCDIALGVMNPWKMDFKRYLNHDLTILKEKFRLVKVIKNRLGRDNVAFGYAFNAEAGKFQCLPPADEVDLFGGYDKYLK
jgi:hypothetical protein